MKIIKLTFTIVLLSLAFFACKKKQAPGYSTVKVDEVFEMKMSQSVEVKDAGLKLTFTAVPADSRCPKGVNCIQEGDVKVTMAAVAGMDNRNLEFVMKASQASPASQTFAGYKIQLLSVMPYPEADKQIKKEDYVLKLAVRKL